MMQFQDEPADPRRYLPPEPPGITRANIEAVRYAREYLAEPPLQVAPNEVLQGLLDAYDVLGARLAWIAALYAELINEVAQGGER